MRNEYKGVDKETRDARKKDLDNEHVICWACFEDGNEKKFKYITAKHLVSNHNNGNQFTSMKTAIAEYKDLYPNATIARKKTVNKQFSTAMQDVEDELEEVAEMTADEIESFIDKHGGLYNWGLNQKIRLFFKLDKIQKRWMRKKRLGKEDVQIIRSLGSTMHSILKEVVPSQEEDKDKGVLTGKQEKALANATILLERIQEDLKVTKPSKLIQNAYTQGK